jgi:hypothetical protein
LLDHVIPASEEHLRRLVRDYVAYFHEDRTHDSLDKDTPGRRPVEQRPSLKSDGNFKRVLGRSPPPLLVEPSSVSGTSAKNSSDRVWVFERARPANCLQLAKTCPRDATRR